VPSTGRWAREILNLIRRLLQIVPKKYIGLLDYFVFRPTKSYSQHGEDITVLRYFNYHGPAKGVYLDIGCFHPRHDSNTYLLYKRGWRGINVDAEQYKIDVFRVAGRAT